MKRRAILLAAGAVLATRQFAARAADKKVRVGILVPGPSPTPAAPQPWVEAFRKEMGALGWVEGRSLVIEIRYGESRPEKLKAAASELMSASVDVVVGANTAASAAARGASQSIPIVMASAADPVGAGLMKSLAQPEYNVTGLTLQSADLAGKRLELLKELLPALDKVAAFAVSREAARSFSRAAQAVMERWLEANARAAAHLGLSVGLVDLGLDPARFDEAHREARARGFQAATIIETSTYTAHRAQLAQAALKNRLPTIYGTLVIAEVGGLMAYSADIADLWRRAARFVDKILRGAKPGELPVEQPTKFEFVLNLKTAKALGITIPPSILLRADRVIE